MQNDICVKNISVSDVNESIYRMACMIFEVGNRSLTVDSGTNYVIIKYVDSSGKSGEERIDNLEGTEILKGAIYAARENKCDIRSIERVMNNGLTVALAFNKSQYEIKYSKEYSNDILERLNVMCKGNKPCNDTVIRIRGTTSNIKDIAKLAVKRVGIRECLNVHFGSSVINIVHCDKVIVAVSNEYVYLIDLYSDNEIFMNRILHDIESAGLYVEIEERSYI